MHGMQRTKAVREELWGFYRPNAVVDLLDSSLAVPARPAVLCPDPALPVAAPVRRHHHHHPPEILPKPSVVSGCL